MMGKNDIKYLFDLSFSIYVLKNRRIRTYFDRISKKVSHKNNRDDCFLKKYHYDG